MGKVTFLDSDLERRFKNNGVLYKYTAIKWLEDGSIYFSNPFNNEAWKDPFERWYIEASYKFGSEVFDYKFKDRLLCLCLTKKQQNEASWYVYANTDDKTSNLVKLSILPSNLISALEKLEDYDVYVGNVKYVFHSDMLKYSPAKHIGAKREEFNDQSTWIKMMFLKRSAFEYEDHPRIVLVSKRTIDKKEKGFPIPIDLKLSDYVAEAFLLANEKGELNRQDVKTLNKFGIVNVSKENLYVHPVDRTPWNLNHVPSRSKNKL